MEETIEKVPEEETIEKVPDSEQVEGCVFFLSPEHHIPRSDSVLSYGTHPDRMFR